MPTVEEVFEDLPDFIPSVEEDEDEDSGQGPEVSTHNPDKLEEGDRVFMTTMQDPLELIWASATMSQHLSKAFAKNSAGPKAFRDSIPAAFHDFENVFSKESFDALPVGPRHRNQDGCKSIIHQSLPALSE